jgi:hypothetical protein
MLKAKRAKYPAAVGLDIAYLATGNTFLATFSFWSIVGGVLGSLFAAIVGVADWLGLESGTRAKRIRLWHGSVNVSRSRCSRRVGRCAGIHRRLQVWQLEIAQAPSGPVRTILTR